MSMAQVIRAAMKKQGVTVSQLSRQLGCTTQNISGKCAVTISGKMRVAGNSGGYRLSV